MAVVKDIRTWWHGIPALPADRADHAYFALRRLWADHTMTGNRGFYRLGSEDHVTPTLFQTWALFADLTWINRLVTRAGGTTGKIRRARWAYACEEVIDSKLRPFHKRDYIIADILLCYEDDVGAGVVGFEVKRPGKAAVSEDARKLESYIDLPSTRRIHRRHGCLLVGASVAENTRSATSGQWPVVTWEETCEWQTAAVRSAVSSEVADVVADWIAWHFAQCGASIHPLAAAPPLPFGSAYGALNSYTQIDRLELSDSLKRFLKGSEAVEAARRGETPAPPIEWLALEPSAEQVRQRKWQTTKDRRLCRWSFDWSSTQERAW